MCNTDKENRANAVIGEKFNLGELCYKVISLAPNEVMIVAKEDLIDYYGSYQDLPAHLELPESISYKGETYLVSTIEEDAFKNSDLIEIVIPNSVKKIGSFAFSFCLGLKEVKLANSIEYIGEGAFSYCASLEEIVIPSSVSLIEEFNFTRCRKLKQIKVSDDNKFYSSLNGILFNKEQTKILRYPIGLKAKHYTIPNSVTSIERYAFDYSKLESIVLPDGIITIKGCAFVGCDNLVKINIPNSVTSIGDNAFDFCPELKVIKLPTSLSSIGDRVFISCKKLEKIDISEDNKSFSVVDGVLFDKEQTELIFYPYTLKQKHYTMPNSVLHIRGCVFGHNSSLESIQLSSSLVSIGEWAFNDCLGLTSIGFPDSLRTIGDFAFRGCSNLSSIKFSKNLSSIGISAFIMCTSLESVDLPDTITSIENNTFYHCSKLKYVNLPNTLKSIDSGAFARCSSLVALDLPSSLTMMGKDAFNDCPQLSKIEISPDNKYFSVIDGVLFNKELTELIYYPCSLKHKHYIISESVLHIRDNAFADSKNLSSVDLPSSLISIGDSAFYGCSNLESIELPSTITTIEGWAFRSPNLTTLISHIKDLDKVDVDSDAFDDILESCTLYVPKGMLEAYSSTDPWKSSFAEIKEIEE